MAGKGLLEACGDVLLPAKPCEGHRQVGILAKRLTADRVSIEIQERHLHARVISPEGEQEFDLDVELYDEVGE